MSAAEAMRARAGQSRPADDRNRRAIDRLRAVRGPVLKAEILSEIFGQIPAAASGYLVRILTGDFRIGLKEGLLEDAIAQGF